ncbi:small multi-drug export protein [Geomicrobium sediminis]|uniref:Membrane protein YqaA with SNARE-associated domain n=1 Tax=Geomicrobium sediminis TaxID=1347788 RepID=A0ABS2P731_9BACL|nr:small multi-drug export protein [Geomicrobium sediminis]MBM7631218.1 membrane protein YqaA with SNARE-associated domain [Geomicrobium sediminis]
MFNDLSHYFFIFIASLIPFMEVMIAIPTGIVLFNLHPVTTTFVATVGNIVSIVVFVFLGNSIRKFSRRIKRRSTRIKKQPNPKFEHFYTKYGVAGLSLLGTFLLSSQLTATAIVSFEDSKGKATLWVSIAVVILAIVMMLLSIFAAEWLSNLLNL